MVLWLQFLLCAGLILVSGVYVSRYGDVIAEKSGLGRTWIGVVLVASITSLPELVTGVSSVALFDLPDIAAANVLGACLLNLAMIPVLDFLNGSEPISARIHQGHVLTAGFGILMLGVVSLGTILGPRLPSIGWVGVGTPLFIAVYLVAMRMVFVYERRRIAEFVREMAEEARYRHVSKRRAYALFALNALVIVGAALYLPRLGEQIAEATGLGQTFVGTVFIAISTTLPELVVSVSALAIGAADMAVGNLFGSTVFNVFILAVDDLLYPRAPLLAVVSPDHVVSALSAMIALSIAVIGLVYRSGRKPIFFGWDSLAILAVYLVNLSLLYATR
ncbi:MAG TPA: sodium:calcium antiporter [candidate division Zixibacteria bacterium]|nr:sodium:calcium antiporter [candidate division Zixibacteria bacterium]